MKYKILILALFFAAFASAANKYRYINSASLKADGQGGIYAEITGLDTIVSGDTLFIISDSNSTSSTNRYGYSMDAILTHNQLSTDKDYYRGCRPDSIYTWVFGVSADADAQNIERYTSFSFQRIGPWVNSTIALGDSLTIGSTSGTTASKRFANIVQRGMYQKQYFVQKDATDTGIIRSIKIWVKKTCS